ncbi:hypothetical protein Ahy_B09g095454 [Arachis hypogaea]|uniref:Uncharacterized protein n=1 Tax=Arachis hypogaea TaxID=3818 RepID=A0A444XER6_ARAHY|nr:hypothetical protein Ahy_B09g095454 [Arachis hypogaea]
MATNGALSTSRRSVSGVRQENSVLISVPCVVYVGNLNDGVAPRSFCGVFAIMHMSRTISDPNRIFLSFPFYKEKQLHCKFFVWVDEHLARIGSNGCISDKRHLGEKDVEVVEEKKELDHMMAVLEEKVTALEKKKIPLTCCIDIIVCAVCVGFLFSA